MRLAREAGVIRRWCVLTCVLRAQRYTRSGLGTAREGLPSRRPSLSFHPHSWSRDTRPVVLRSRSLFRGRREQVADSNAASTGERGGTSCAPLAWPCPPETRGEDRLFLRYLLLNVWRLASLPSRVRYRICLLRSPCRSVSPPSVSFFPRLPINVNTFEVPGGGALRWI